MSNDLNASNSNAITFNSSNQSSSGNFSSYAILNDLMGEKNVENLQLLYNRYSFIPKNSFLTSLKTKDPVVKSSENDPRIYLEMDLDEEVRLLNLPQGNQMEVFLNRSDKERLIAKKKSFEKFYEKLKKISLEKRYKMDEVIVPEKNLRVLFR